MASKKQVVSVSVPAVPVSVLPLSLPLAELVTTVTSALSLAIAAHTGAVGGSVIETERANKAAEIAVGEAQTSALAGIVKAWTGYPSVNALQFDTDIKDKMFASFKALQGVFKSDKNISNRLYRDRMAIVAITNGLLPNEMDTCLEAFYKRIGATVQATNGPDGKPLFVAKTGTGGGRPKKVKGDGESAGAESPAKAIEMTRQTACNVLACGNLADKMMFEYFADHLPQARMAYSMMNPVKVS